MTNCNFYYKYLPMSESLPFNLIAVVVAGSVIIMVSIKRSLEP